MLSTSSGMQARSTQKLCRCQRADCAYPACAARLNIIFQEAGYSRQGLLFQETILACGSRGGGANASAAVAGVGALRGGGDGRHAAEVVADPLAHPGMDTLPVKPALKVCTQ